MTWPTNQLLYKNVSASFACIVLACYTLARRPDRLCLVQTSEQIILLIGIKDSCQKSSSRLKNWIQTAEDLIFYDKTFIYKKKKKRPNM